MNSSQNNLLDIIEHINPSDLSYQEWVNVGMGLQHEGYDVGVWDRWSSRDAARYHRGECQRKWNTFHGSSNPVTGGTIIQMAMEHGWIPERNSHALDWDDTIEKDDMVIVDRHYIEGMEIQEPEHWNPAGELIRYLEALFEASENVGYVTSSWEKDGRYMPTQGS